MRMNISQLVMEQATLRYPVCETRLNVRSVDDFNRHKETILIEYL